MKRTPEPELMDDAAQAEAYAAEDFSATDAAFAAAFVDRFGAEWAGPIADLGCGPGNIAIQLARALPGVAVEAFDGAEAMLALGRERAQAEGVAERIRFTQATLPSPALPGRRYAAVVSNSLLHHLHAPEVLWAAIRHIASPGAPVFVGDLRRPATAEEAERLVSLYADGAPEVLRRDFHASLHAAFEVDEIEAQLRAAGFSGWTVAPVGDRHVHVYGRAP